MANPHIEQNLLTSGIVSNGAARGSFAKNVFFRNGKMEVRQGFGQVAEFDTDMGLKFGATDEWGYQKHLGSYTFITPFGHTQIISAFLAKVNTTDLQYYNITSAQLCIVSIYDVTTGDRWEEPLYRHTSENNKEVVPISWWRGIEESNIEEDFQSWVHITGWDTFYFMEFRGVLFLGSRETGLLAYYPTIFAGNRRKQINKSAEVDWHPPYSESAVLLRAVPSPGDFEEGVVYFTQSELPNPTAIAAVGNRMVYASGRTLFFSEPGKPTNIRADNTIILSDIKGNITALAAQFGNIHVFTETEVWTYHPNEGASVVSLGRLNPLSHSVGCSGKNAIVYKEGKVIWTDQNGIYATTGNYVVENLSDAIDDFFRDRGLGDPTSHYHPEDGYISLKSVVELAPKSYYHFNPESVNLTYWHAKGLLLATFPNEKCTLVLCDNGQWCLWVYDSNTMTNRHDQAGVHTFIDAPWLMASGQELFLVNTMGIDQEFLGGELTDYAKDENGTLLGKDVTPYSYSILQYARGGGLDRSSRDEDNRTISHNYSGYPPQSSIDGAVRIDQWIPMRIGDRLPGVLLDIASDDDSVLIPISVMVRTAHVPAGAINLVHISMRFDKLIWEPYLINGTEVPYVLPPERLASNGGYSPGVVVPGVSEVSLYDSFTGLPSATGNEVRVWWNRAAAGVTMNLVGEQMNRLIYIPMKLKDTEAADVSSMIVNLSGQVDAEALTPMIWHQWTLDYWSQNVRDRKAQAVDWAYKTSDLDPEHSNQIKAHGLVMRVESRGDGERGEFVTFDGTATWSPGMLNVSVDKDGDAWQAQRINFWDDEKSGVRPSVTRNEKDLDTTKASFKGTQNGATTQEPVFDTPEITWGDASTDSPNGSQSYLISDPTIQEFTTSDSIRGRQISYLLHGYMQHRAHRLIFDKISGLFSVYKSGPLRRDADGAKGTP